MSTKKKSENIGSAYRGSLPNWGFGGGGLLTFLTALNNSGASHEVNLDMLRSFLVTFS